jgi:rubrerythrin
MDRTTAIDFEKLTLRDALDLAVLVEEEAKDRYGELADQMQIHHNPEAEKFFRYMQVIESKHEDKLAERRKKLFGDAPRVVRREMIFDIEAPEYDEARANMTARQAFEAALRSEQKAGAFFEGALGGMKDTEARALFMELRAEEKEHAALVEKEIAKLPPDEGPVRPEDVDDGPVAL